MPSTIGWSSAWRPTSSSAFLAYCLQVTLKNQLMLHPPGLTPQAVLEKMGTIQMIEVWIPTLDGRWLVLPRYTQPEKEVQILLDRMKRTLPSQPPPRLTIPTGLAPQLSATDQHILW